MRFSHAVLSYLISFLICIGVPVVLALLSRKKRPKIHWFHFLLGMVFFILLIGIYYLVLSRHLQAADGIANYNNTQFYRVTVITLLTVVLAVLLYIFARLVYLRKQKFEQNFSFFAGIGSGGVVLIGMYCLAMLVVLVLQYFGTTLLSFDSAVQAFYFDSDTYISVFMPIWGHVSFAAAALCFMGGCVAFGVSANRMAVQKKMKWFSVFLIALGELAALCIMIDLFCFMVMWSVPHYFMALFMFVLAAFLVFLTVKIDIGENAPYEKQFQTNREN